MLKKVFIGYNISEEHVARLKEVAEEVDYVHDFRILTVEELKEKMVGCDVISIIPLIPINKDVIDCSPNLKYISCCSSGFDQVDIPYATSKGILVTNAPTAVASSVAELALALLLTGCRQIVPAANYCNSNQFVSFKPMTFPGLTIRGKRVGIVGPGNIGTEIAKKLTGFDPEIVYSGHRENEKINSYGGKLVSFDELIETADFIIISCPLNDSTRHIFNKSVFSKMKKTVGIVNVGRGPLVHTDDVVEALQNENIKFYATDVTDPEPLPANHPLYKLPNAIVTPHIGASTREAVSGVIDLSIQTIIDYARSKPINHVINPSVIKE